MNMTELDELQWKSPEWIQTFGLRTDNVLDYFAESPFFDKTSNNHVIKMQRQFSSTLQQQQQQNSNNNNISSSENNNGLVLPTGDTNNNNNDNIDNNDNNGGGSDGNDSNNGDRRRKSNEFYYLDGMRQDIVNRYPIHASIERELSKLSGIEYVLLTVREPDFWVIRKQYRQRNENDNHMDMDVDMDMDIDISMDGDMNKSTKFTFKILKDYYIVGANVYQAPSIYKVIKNRLMSTTFNLSKILKDMDRMTHFEPLQGIQFKQVQQQQQQEKANNTNTATNTTLAATLTATQPSPMDSQQNKETLTAEMMDKLLTASLKSEPEYI
ncbi:mediator complex subunit MED6 PWA37_004550 [Arxiozyma heterogenica]|uniref:mediator complex subunit MED6 n=1 Tax=Arxiozyma heterogenica TaxID=278026 RepID=UPI002EF2E195